MKVKTLTIGEVLEIEGQPVKVLREHKHSMFLSKKYVTTKGPIFFHAVLDKWMWYTGPQPD